VALTESKKDQSKQDRVAGGPSADAIDLTELAENLLTVMADLRQSGRILAVRPPELFPLSSAQLELLRTVRTHPGISVAQAAQLLRIAPNTVSTLVRQLTADGLIERRVDPLDRRVARLDLTATTKRNVGAFRDRRMNVLAQAMSEFSARDQRKLAEGLNILGRLVDRLRELESDGD
jgi:DNA-binding MarR family transcriptional regulator